MPDYHDPIRQAETLSELYSQDKRPLGLFLTAGCPYAVHIDGRPLLPDISGLTKIVGDELKPETLKGKFDHALHTLTEDGVKEPTIEDVLSYVRALRVVVGKDRLRDFSADELDSLDAAISEKIVKIVDVQLPERASPFVDLATWIGSVARTNAVELFTTNYDLLFEQALERAHIPYFDGFGGTQRAFFDPQGIEDETLPPRWARLWKLHGSINWVRDNKGNTIRTGGPVVDGCPLIHPSHLKYSESRRMPYLAMIDRMRLFLRQPSATMVVCGYSFRDDHLNEVLMQGTQGNSSAAVFALLFGPLDSYAAAIKIAEAIPSFNALATDEAVIGSKCGPWRLAEAVGAPEALATFWRSEKTVDDLIVGSFLLGNFVNLGAFLAALTARRT